MKRTFEEINDEIIKDLIEERIDKFDVDAQIDKIKKIRKIMYTSSLLQVEYENIESYFNLNRWKYTIINGKDFKKIIFNYDYIINEYEKVFLNNNCVSINLPDILDEQLNAFLINNGWKIRDKAYYVKEFGVKFGVKFEVFVD